MTRAIRPVWEDPEILSPRDRQKTVSEPSAYQGDRGVKAAHQDVSLEVV
jgi:hypothetical protein